MAESAKNMPQRKNRHLHLFEELGQPEVSQLGGKGAHLVELRKGNIPVPDGYCIPVDAHTFFIENGFLPPALLEEMKEGKRRLGGKVAVRSSAVCEDGTELSMAGVFKTHYVYADEDLQKAVEDIYTHATSEEVGDFLALHNRPNETARMALVMQELVEPGVSGVIYTGVNKDALLIQYCRGFGTRLVNGETHGATLLLTADGTVTQSTGFENLPLSRNVIAQLTAYSHVIEHLFGDTPQDIEFVCREGKVSIVQARPLTTEVKDIELNESLEDCLEATKEKIRRYVANEKRDMGTYTAIFSDGNYSELLPRPTEMDIGLHMYVWGGSDGVPGAKQIGHSKMGYLVGEEAVGIIHFIGGRTYASTARYAAHYHIGFPQTAEEYFSTLVNEYLAAVEADPEKGAYPQMGLFLQNPTLEDLQKRFGDRAEEYYAVYQRHSAEMKQWADEFLSTFHSTELPGIEHFITRMQSVDLASLSEGALGSYCAEVLEHIRTVSYVDFVKAARLGFYYSERLRTLLREKKGMGVDEADKMYSRLNQGLDGSAITDANLAIADAQTDAAAMAVARELIGHFSMGEMLEIRHPTLRERPEELESYVKGIRQSGTYREQFEKQRKERLEAQKAVLEDLTDEDRAEFREVMHASSTYMALRETVKYIFAKENLLLKDALETISKKLGLPEGDIYFIYPREIPLLLSDPNSMRHLIRSRKQSFENYQHLDLPAVIRESDIDALTLKKSGVEDFTEATGKFLAEGPSVEGVVVNIDDYDTLAEARDVFAAYYQEGIPIILVATQMNLSHDPLIAQAAGLVISNAGIVAHGAQRARELGKGAIAGIRSENLKTGMRVSFDPATRVVRKK